MSAMTHGRRAYVQRGRATSAAETRATILTAARDLIPETEFGLGVDEIARRAGVAVQTVYDHFGSKGGLLMAVVDDVQRSAGLYDAFGRVFLSPDGETALRRMIGATLAVWHSAWPYIEFMLRSRRIDPVVKAEVALLDASRHAHLWAISRRLQNESRIRGQHSAAWAADQAFAMTHPVVYEELAVRRGWTLGAATTAVTSAITAAILEPGSTPVRSPAPDWPALQAAATARANRAGAARTRSSA
jgi:AcrR family transcriptional regulator